MAVIKHLVDLDLSKNQLLNAVVQNLATAPSTPSDGQIYWDTTANSLFVWNATGSVWIDLGENGVTNLSYSPGVSQGTVVSDSGSNATIPLADGVNAGLMSAAEKTLLGNQSGTNTGDNAVNTLYSGLVSNVTTNLGVTENTITNTITSSDGTDATLTGATTLKAGLMTKAIFDEHVVNNAKVSNVDETLTTLGLAANILKYTDEDGTETDLDLTLYLDDTNLARLTSGSIDSGTGLATFTRDDASTFTIDMSAFLDAITLNNTLTSTSTTEGLTAAQGKVLKDLIDGLNVGTGTNTGDEVQATTSVAGIAEIATQSEVNTGTGTNTIVTPSALKSTLGVTATLSTTLTYSELIGGVGTSYVVTHGIGNQFVQVSTYEVAALDKVECEVELTSINTVTLKFNTTPSLDSIRVVIIG
jgi:hypothetical protein